MAKAPSCSFRHLLKASKSGSARSAREYTTVAVLTARHLLRVRKPFESSKVNLRQLDRSRSARRHVSEFLSAWADPHRGMSTGAHEALQACPQLQARAKKFWKGY
jgi:hypothetical protein